MEINKLSATSIEVITPIVNTYEHKELLEKKAALESALASVNKQIDNYVDRMLQHLRNDAANLQAEIDNIDLLLSECTKLDVTSVKEIVEDKIIG